MLMMTLSPMSMRPSMVAEPMCGSSTTLPSVASWTKALVHRRLVFEHVKTGTRQPALLERLDQRVLVDDAAAGGIDDIGTGLHQLEPAAERKVEGRGPSRGNAPRRMSDGGASIWSGLSQ